MNLRQCRTLMAAGLTLSAVTVSGSISVAQPVIALGAGQVVVPKGHLRVHNGLKTVDANGRFVYTVTFVSLFKDGQLIRSADLYNSPNSAAGSLEWEGLPVGIYEVHFQTRGFGTMIKKVTVNPTGLANVELDLVTRSDEVWDGGPTVYEMEKQIQTLAKAELLLESRLAASEKRNAELESRLAAVEKAGKK